MSDSEDFSKLDDPAFLALRRQVREELEHETNPALAARHQRLNEEFLRRASIAWASQTKEQPR